MTIDRHRFDFSLTDLSICVLLGVVALLVRVWLALQLPFPPLDDPAGYIQLARNIASGRGLMSDVLWNYWISFPTVTHPSNEFWMPLASLIMAGSMRVFGDTLLAAQLPGLIAGALLSPLVYGMGRTLWPDQRRWSVLAAVLIMISAVLRISQSAPIALPSTRCSHHWPCSAERWRSIGGARAG